MGEQDLSYLKYIPFRVIEKENDFRVQAGDLLGFSLPVSSQ